MKKFIIALSFFFAFAFGADYENSYDDEGRYSNDLQEERSIHNQILREAGCKAINVLGNGHFLCLRWPK